MIATRLFDSNNQKRGEPPSRFWFFLLILGGTISVILVLALNFTSFEEKSAIRLTDALTYGNINIASD